LSFEQYLTGTGLRRLTKSVLWESPKRSCRIRSTQKKAPCISSGALLCRAEAALLNFNKVRIARADHPLRIHEAVHVPTRPATTRATRNTFTGTMGLLFSWAWSFAKLSWTCRAHRSNSRGCQRNRPMFTNPTAQRSSWCEANFMGWPLGTI
jgi:hypothetical protein